MWKRPFSLNISESHWEAFSSICWERKWGLGLLLSSHWSATTTRLCSRLWKNWPFRSSHQQTLSLDRTTKILDQITNQPTKCISLLSPLRWNAAHRGLLLLTTRPDTLWAWDCFASSACGKRTGTTQQTHSLFNITRSPNGKTYRLGSGYWRRFLHSPSNPFLSNHSMSQLSKAGNCGQPASL